MPSGKIYFQIAIKKISCRLEYIDNYVFLCPPLFKEEEGIAKRANKKSGPRSRNAWMSFALIPNVNAKGRRVWLMCSPMAPTVPDALGKRDSFSAEPVTKPSPIVPRLPSLTCEAPRKEYLWASTCWPRALDFAAPPAPWRQTRYCPQMVGCGRIALQAGH